MRRGGEVGVWKGLLWMPDCEGLGRELAEREGWKRQGH